MNLISRLINRLPKQTPSASEEQMHTLFRALDSDAQELRAVDPDTTSQWHYLNVAIHRAAASATPVHNTWWARLANPAPAIALGLVVLIAGSIFLFTRDGSMKYETRRGQLSTVLLADSSEVILHHTSELTVDRTLLRNARRVSLKGEAYFRVRKTGSPFIVSTEVGTVQVLGTEFNVRMRGDLLEVGVNSGSVQLSVHMNGRDSAVVLGPGEMVKCTRNHFPGTPEHTLFADYPGWNHGKLLFQRADIGSVCKEIEDRFDISLRIEDPQVKNGTITGSIDARSVEAALSTLSTLTGKKYRHENSGYSLY